MANVQITVMNQSTVLGDAEILPVVAALKQQVSRDFAPVWGIDADLTFVPQGTIRTPNTWWLDIFDNSDQAGALGYHDLTSDGFPLGKVFAGTDKQYGSEWTVTASHELLEMLGDPDINLAATAPGVNGNVMRLYAYEVADACEADQFGYQIDGVLVSDFIFPSWFESFRQPNSTKFDYQGKITQPFQLLSGGYISIYDVSSGNGWSQLNAQAEFHRYESRARVGSRRERRLTPRSRWLRSDPKA